MLVVYSKIKYDMITWLIEIFSHKNIFNFTKKKVYMDKKVTLVESINYCFVAFEMCQLVPSEW